MREAIPASADWGLKTALERLAEQLSSENGISVSCSCRGSLDLATDMTVMLYQFARELLQNVARHSNAGNAEIRLHGGKDAVEMIVKDDGAGFDIRHCSEPGIDSGFGLFSIRERVNNYNGKMSIRSGPGKGTRVKITLPTGPS